MAKRKTTVEDDSSSDEENPGLIDVEFDFFDLNAAVDYHAIKRLLSQLLLSPSSSEEESESFLLHQLTELVLSQPRVGTTIKTDGIDSDPLALLTVLNMWEHRAHPSVTAIAQYMLAKSAATNPALHATLTQLFADQTQTQNHVGLVLCERLINMPVQVIPPMYKMLADELKWAIDDNEPYRFTHLIFLSRAYHLSPEEEAAMMSPSGPAAPPSKKKSRANATAPTNTGIRPQDGIYSFHPEDDLIVQFATHHTSYPLSTTTQERDSESFGLDTRGRIMVVPAGNFEELVRRLGVDYAPPS